MPARVYSCSYKSPVENRPKWLYRSSCPETNMFATSVIKSKSSVISLCDVNIANELNLFCFMVARSHVFTLRIIENERSAVAVVGATTSKSLTIFSTEGIISQLSRLHCFSTSMISNACEGLFFLQMKKKNLIETRFVFL